MQFNRAFRVSFGAFKVLDYDEAEDWILRARMDGVRVVDMLAHLNAIKAKHRNGKQRTWWPNDLRRIFKMYGMEKKRGLSYRGPYRGQALKTGHTLGSWRHWTNDQLRRTK
jgi:hypothetical protein